MSVVGWWGGGGEVCVVGMGGGGEGGSNGVKYFLIRAVHLGHDDVILYSKAYEKIAYAFKQVF